jgi:hypothetical protein
MRFYNAALGTLLDGVIYPFRDVHPLVSLTILALLTAMGMLVAFRVTSNQPKLEQVKRRIQASLFEIRLFNDDPRAILRAQADILRHNAVYLGLTVVPMLCMVPILVPVLIHLDQRYGYADLRPGDEAVVTVTLSGPGDGGARPSVTATAPPGVAFETPMVWIPSSRQGAWRLHVADAGEFDLHFRMGDADVTKRVRAGQGIGRRSPVRPEATFVDQLWYPAEAPLPAGGPLVAIAVSYPRTDVSVLGWRLHWMVAFVVLSLAFALVLRRRFGVTL